jgi:hypothetical protein
MHGLTRGVGKVFRFGAVIHFLAKHASHHTVHAGIGLPSVRYKLATVGHAAFQISHELLRVLAGPLAYQPTDYQL